MLKEQLAIAEQIAVEINASKDQVISAIRLLEDGASVPFIARYRKEQTKGLDDVKLRTINTRLQYLTELNERRTLVINCISEQNRMTDALLSAIQAADTKTRLEDLYLPYRPKRRTKATIAKEKGLAKLADFLLKEKNVIPEVIAKEFISDELGVPDVKAALSGALQIIMESFAEHPDLLKALRKVLWQDGILTAAACQKKEDKNAKFQDYYNYSERVNKIPAHRALALFRGRADNSLKLSIKFVDENFDGVKFILDYFKIPEATTPVFKWLKNVISQTWSMRLFPKVELEIFKSLRDISDEEAIKVFSKNLKDLLLKAPAGNLVTIGLDPGIKTGVKVAVVDETGKVLDTTTIFLIGQSSDWHQAKATLAKLAIKYKARLISIGNGTGSRETVRMVADLIRTYPDLNLQKVLVNEAGASVYSASELATNELPELDVSLRGAVSIARRLQDPLAELVKIDSKSIGVGQYQHDVNQTRLQFALEAVVEDAVCAVGVDVNLASAPLLSRVSGLNAGIAKKLVEYRDKHGAFKTREELKLVAQMGEKTYQQSAGFLRIIGGNNSLDSSGVHPEAYSIVEKILKDKSISLQHLICNKEVLQTISANDYILDNYGIPTIQDILQELEKPGRDPRPEFHVVNFKDEIEKIDDLYVGLELEGIVSNVTNFGAFVDIGVHQDGLIHISAMGNKFIKDPRDL